jgi:hypothetical protein
MEVKNDFDRDISEIHQTVKYKARFIKHGLASRSMALNLFIDYLHGMSIKKETCPLNS